ncbi:DUF4082 domain-containing protein [Actinokineospora sp. NPDC004072]
MGRRLALSRGAVGGPRIVLAGLMVAVGLPVLVALPASAGPCDAPTNPVVCENSKPGTPRDDWFIESPYGDIEGFATAASVQPGERLDFKIKTPSTDYEVDIVRLGWYQGNGGRLQATLSPTAPLPQSQPQCAYDGSTGLVDCGNWGVSASWFVPPTAVSGFYVANFIRNDQPGASQFPFVVRNDSSRSDIVVQTSDQTWQAYNKWGDRPGVNDFNLYEGGFPGSPDGRAFKVSYNRPYRNAGTSNFLNAEYPMVRFLERNGYDVSYISGVDATRDPGLLRNHKVFMSSGHDEYHNARQRDGIEAARDAGVNLFWATGNTMFWKTRFENSIDGSNTPYRTLACYKETKAPGGAKIDPHPEWTGTWRDPRSSPPSDGGQPENALIGALFMVNGYRADAIEVPKSYGRNRLWRNTSVATATGTTRFPAGTLGYEWDTDPDNGFRPAGSIRLSHTTVNVDFGMLLLDHGNTYGAGPADHNITLYRDPESKALVFNTATVQWAWGLDDDHTFPYGAPPTAPTSPAMQQATVNMLADMGAQPRTLMPGLVAATKSTDITGPNVTINGLSNGQTIPAGTTVNLTGTAADVGGGKVAGVEVSVDGGTTWKRANGLDSWSYQWTPSTLGPASVKVRASDDLATIGNTLTVNVTVGPQQCPCSIFGNATPATIDSGDNASIEVGTKFTTSVNATVTGMRFYKAAANTGTHTGSLWSPGGQRLATGTFHNETASGWQTLTFDRPVQIRSGTPYVVSYHAPAGRYSVDAGYFNDKGAGIVPVTAPKSSSVAGGNGVFKYGQGFPDTSFNGGNYWVDVIVTTDTADNTRPTVQSVSPAAGAAYLDSSITATFNEDVDPGSVRFTVQAGGNPIAGTVTADGPVARFTATDLLPPNTQHSVEVTATDGYGNALAAPRKWSFTTGTGLAPCPCTLFGQRTPAVVEAADTGDVELGVKFAVSANATATGVRFYKSAGNTGTHTGTLWTGTGQRLATGTFTDETESGWQTLSFDKPVQLSAGQTYVASYRAPHGRYSVDPGYFADKGAGRGILTAPSSPAAGGQGVYVYGGGFPTSSFNHNNYWVDVIVDTEGADTTPPAVTSTSPANGATDVPTGTGVTVTFSEAINPAKLQFTVSQGASSVPGSVRVAPDGSSATFVSTTPLPGSAALTASVRASDPMGNPMPAPHTWSFTTAASGACPCSLFRPTDTPATSAVDSPVELGVRVVPAVDGWITGVRFYQTAGDPGTHTGTLWSPSGAVLAIGAFPAQSAAGWRTLSFAEPVPVTAGTAYVVSYWTSAGRYGLTRGFFGDDHTAGLLTAPAATAEQPNGVFQYGGGGVFPTGSGDGSNYWVDAVFTTTRP